MPFRLCNYIQKKLQNQQKDLDLGKFFAVIQHYPEYQSHAVQVAQLYWKKLQHYPEYPSQSHPVQVVQLYWKSYNTTFKRGRQEQKLTERFSFRKVKMESSSLGRMEYLELLKKFR